MASLADRGLLAIGVQQADLRPRFINYAADHFAQIARGEKPPRPETFVAEIAAEVCASAVGAEVPMPMQPMEKRTYAKRKDEDQAPVTGSIEGSPEARAWIASHGIKQIFQSTVLVVSAFLQHPTRWWRSRELAGLLNRKPYGLTHLLGKLKDKGVLISEGERSQCLWKLAEMPPHV